MARNTADRKRVAAKDDEESELKYIAKAFKIPIAKVREAREAAGVSREAVYIKLREMGYSIEVKTV